MSQQYLVTWIIISRNFAVSIQQVFRVQFVQKYFVCSAKIWLTVCAKLDFI